MISEHRTSACLRALGVVAIGAVALTGCSSGGDAQASDDGPPLTIPREDMGNFTRNFNPFSPNAAPMTHQAIYESLLIYNPAQEETIPWLADGWQTSDDERSLTFELRPDVRWSDGEPLVAEDVTASVELHQELLGEFEYVDSAEAVDDTTVTIHLTDPFSPALHQLGQMSVVPAHIWSEHEQPAEDLNEDPVGTGPYTEIVDFQSQSFELGPNPEYWQPEKQQVPGVRMLAFAGNDGANLAAVNGDVDWAPQYMPDIETTFIERDPEHRNYWFPPTGAQINWQLNTQIEPFDDPKVRKALSMAIDRDHLVEVGMSGYTKPADCTGLVGTYESWRDSAAASECGWTDHDPDAAAEMLDELGYEEDDDGIRRLSEDDEFTFEISVGSTSSDWLSVANIIAQDLEDIGIQATVDSPDWASVVAGYETGDFTSGIVWSANEPSPYQYFRSLMSTETVTDLGEQTFENYHRFGDERADALLDELAETSDADTQQQLVSELQELYSETAPVVPLFPGPEWGAYTTENFEGWPNEEDPYATLSTRAPTTVLVLTSLEPVD